MEIEAEKRDRFGEMDDEKGARLGKLGLKREQGWKKWRLKRRRWGNGG